MTNFKKELAKFEYDLLKKILLMSKDCHTKILLNLQVSGGMDSMCMLNAFFKILNSKHFENKEKFVFVAQHFNHKQRGQESEEDVVFVSQYCSQYNIPLYVNELQVKDMKAKNFQNDARNWRKSQAISLCQELQKSLKIGKYFIVTAHHARDHVESVLLHILRGCSLNGLVGIQQFDEQNLFFRPFFNISYKCLQRYCHDEQILFRMDSSNLSNDYDRNYIRNSILPHFEHLRPSYEKSFQSLSKHVVEHLETFVEDDGFEENQQILVLNGMSLSDVYRTIINKNKELKNILGRNVMANLLHEMELLKKSRLILKEVKLKNDWVACLMKDNDNIKIQFLKQKY
ncbi:tRNA lysidine(34) synthetase TilS [Spirobacillus cienkowskii]|uniref:tRNA lysidine(34) synthetase TilS n=1 Tax=Spirobacillus cienkowskii TaxID=495820 RepID=UPI0030D135B6